MKKILILSAFILTANLSAQTQESTTRKFIDDAQFTLIEKDWNTTAEFYSGLGEFVKFFPVEITNLKSKTKVKALQLDMDIKKPEVFKTAWVGLDEIDEFIYFIEENVIPNLDLKFKKQSAEYIFKAKEMTFSYLVDEKRKRVSITLNNYDNDGIPNYYFWTESQVNKIPYLLEVLKKIK
ncbi:hypothetical protein [Flavobacterium sp. I3-2]|uniref:hypothetical protein n=1 Tax=Flavobacterium sp. I3-2 TaxID=2748319 RepID=UPI0015A78149|nr:hypothetical protein [Flavobacterium sp. I3-2]